jgi:hypothetical protein
MKKTPNVFPGVGTANLPATLYKTYLSIFEIKQETYG